MMEVLTLPTAGDLDMADLGQALKQYFDGLDITPPY